MNETPHWLWSASRSGSHLPDLESMLGNRSYKFSTRRFLPKPRSTSGAHNYQEDHAEAVQNRFKVDFLHCERRLSKVSGSRDRSRWKCRRESWPGRPRWRGPWPRWRGPWPRWRGPWPCGCCRGRSGSYSAISNQNPEVFRAAVIAVAPVPLAPADVSGIK